MKINIAKHKIIYYRENPSSNFNIIWLDNALNIQTKICIG